MKKQSNVKRFFIVFLPLILLMVFILFPFYWTFVTSVKPQDELYGAVVTYWPSAVTFEAYSKPVSYTHLQLIRENRQTLGGGAGERHFHGREGNPFRCINMKRVLDVFPGHGTD